MGKDPARDPVSYCDAKAVNSGRTDSGTGDDRNLIGIWLGCVQRKPSNRRHPSKMLEKCLRRATKGAGTRQFSAELVELSLFCRSCADRIVLRGCEMLKVAGHRSGGLLFSRFHRLQFIQDADE